MVDYAQSVIKDKNTDVKAKERVSYASVEVALPHLGFALVVAFLVYLLGYQNNTIASVKHNINVKRAKLIELRMQMDSLKAKQAHILSSGSVIADSEAKKMKVAKNIQIVY